MATITVPPPQDSALPPLRVRRDVLETRSFLPFQNQHDLEDALRGFVAAPGYREIPAGEGETAWSVDGADWLLDDPDGLDPFLRRRVALNLSYGLYEVLDGRIYQVRGFDLANMTFVRGETGWIVFDPLTLRETSAAALALVREHVADLPVSAVVYSHGEPDDEGGARGVVDEADVARGRVEVIAPAGHAEYDKPGLGPALGAGPLPATITIEGAEQELTVDGVRMVVRTTGCNPEPAELDVHLPELGAVRLAERSEEPGHEQARPSSGRRKSRRVTELSSGATTFGGDAQVMFAAHRWPQWDAERIHAVLHSPNLPC